MSEVKRCAACRKDNPVSEMKICMHNQMHRYVCDMKCMGDFYNPPKRPTAQSIEAKVSALEAERDELRAQVEAMRASLIDAAKTMHWTQSNTAMSRRVAGVLAKARLSAELAALQANP